MTNYVEGQVIILYDANDKQLREEVLTMVKAFRIKLSRKLEYRVLTQFREVKA